MATLSLRIHIVDCGVTKTVQFNPETTVEECYAIIRDKIVTPTIIQPKDYGLFLSDEESKKGVWLEPARTLEYYILRNGDLLEFRKKVRPLKVQMLDLSMKTVMIDFSQPVNNLMVVICAKVGITNHDEYGLILEPNVSNNGDLKTQTYGTLAYSTLRRPKAGGDEKTLLRDSKMESLRKKIRTDDELNWINPSKTLQEQGFEEGDSVILRRKFFFSDGNVGAHDPIQLNLLYVQARDAVLDGTHPVTEDLACKLAGLQAHVQFGNHDENKHKPQFLDLKEFLPASYVKVKGIEKKIFVEHKRHVGICEVEAKEEYTKTCRALPTYGVTFFLVKEKMAGKNKLIPRLLGINKDSVLRLDEKTKEVMRVYPLTSVRKWSASPTVFALDLGDYSDKYYSAQTPDGAQIVQIIAGYIDIILRKKQTSEYLSYAGCEGAAMVEEIVAPSKASVFQHETNRMGKVDVESLAIPSVMRSGADEWKYCGTGQIDSAECAAISKQTNISHRPFVIQQSQVTNIDKQSPQKALVSTIDTSQEKIKSVKDSLSTSVTLPDPTSSTWKERSISSSKQRVSAHMAALNAATAQIISQAPGAINYTLLEQAINAITTNLPEMSENLKMLAALSPRGSDHILNAAKSLCLAVSDFLTSVQTPTSANCRSLLEAASRVGDASYTIATECGGSNEDQSNDEFISLAKGVARSTATLVVKARNVATNLEQPQQGAVVSAATKCAFVTSQLVACTKVVASTLESPYCRQELVLAAREVISAMEGLVSECKLVSTVENSGIVQELVSTTEDASTQINHLIHQAEVTNPETIYFASVASNKSSKWKSTVNDEPQTLLSELKYIPSATSITNNTNLSHYTNQVRTDTADGVFDYSIQSPSLKHAKSITNDTNLSHCTNQVRTVTANDVFDYSIQFPSLKHANSITNDSNNEHRMIPMTANIVPNEDVQSETLEPTEYFTATTEKVVYNIAQAMLYIRDSSYQAKVFFTPELINECHSRMVASTKNLAKAIHEMMTKPQPSNEKCSQVISECYCQLSNDYVLFASKGSDNIVKHLCQAIHDLGSACINSLELVVPNSPSNSVQQDRRDLVKNVADKVSLVLSALQDCSRGIQACNDAARVISGIIGDLDTTIMFASAGTLHAEEENETFSDHRESILKTAKSLVEDTKNLVTGAALSQEQLGMAAANSTATLKELVEVVKHGAASLGSDNAESQVMLINSVLDVARALSDLIHSTKCASGKNTSHPSMESLKESAKVMVTNLTSLLKTVKVVEDEHLRGTRALESAIAAITQEVKLLSSVPLTPSPSANPEGLIRSTKAITLATAKAVVAGNSLKQDDVIIAANEGRKAISDMLSICKGCAQNAETSELRTRVLSTGNKTAYQFGELLQIIMNIVKPSSTVIDPKQRLPQVSRNIAQSVTELVSLAHVLKGRDWINEDDPTLIAENELLGAAASIDAAAKKLASLKPRKQVKDLQAEESLTFNEMILEAAKSIAAATSALIKAASAAQRELVNRGIVSRMTLNSSDDGQWSEGLISAARLVAAATHSLVESANSLVEGVATEEKLISAAKQVASSTAQLLVACKVKADPNSDTTKGLQTAGNAVKHATDNLVKSAQEVIQHDDERSLVLNKRMVGGIAQEINARSEVLRIEKQLEEARGKLTAIRLAKYKREDNE